MFLVSISFYLSFLEHILYKTLGNFACLAKFSPSLSFKINVLIPITPTDLSINGPPEFPYLLTRSYKRSMKLFSWRLTHRFGT